MSSRMMHSSRSTPAAAKSDTAMSDSHAETAPAKKKPTREEVRNFSQTIKRKHMMREKKRTPKRSTRISLQNALSRPRRCGKSGESSEHKAFEGAVEEENES